MHMFVEWMQRSIETWLVYNVANARTDWGSIAVGGKKTRFLYLLIECQMLTEQAPG